VIEPFRFKFKLIKIFNANTMNKINILFLIHLMYNGNNTWMGFNNCILVFLNINLDFYYFNYKCRYGIQNSSYHISYNIYATDIR